MKRRIATLSALTVSGLSALGLVAVAFSASRPAVFAGGGNEKTALELTAYLPSTINVQQGRSVTFGFRGFHTVTFPKGKKGPEFLLPAKGTYPAANDAAGVPFWWGGQTQLGFNPVAGAPTKSKAVTGTALVNSGFPNREKFTYTATFPKLGTFTYVCLIHPGMKGKVRVVRGPGDTAAQIAAANAKQLEVGLAAGAKIVAADAKLPSTSTTVLVGSGNVGAQHLAFAPKNVTVKAGQVVTFKLNGRVDAHTITFGPKAYVDAVEKRFNGPNPVLDSEVLFSSEAPGAATPVVLTPTSHGNGFVNSGILFDPHAGPGAHTFSVQFTQPGTYAYICFLHSDTMKGTITVTA